MDKIVYRRCRVTFEKLKEMGLRAGLTTRDIRFLNHWLINHSPFAPYFKALGLSRGPQLKRIFYNHRNYDFLDAILKIYYLYCVNAVDPNILIPIGTDTPEELWKMPKSQWDSVLEDVRDEYLGSIQKVSDALRISQGRTEAYKESKREDTGFFKRAMALSDERLLSALDIAHQLDCAPYALALLVRNLHMRPEAQAFLERRHDDIIYGFVTNATWRYYLSVFHNEVGMQEDGKSAYYENDGWIEQITGGISHAELNERAAHYQYKLGSILKHMKKWEPVPEFDLTCDLEQYKRVMAARKKSPLELRMPSNLDTAGDTTEADIPDEIKSLSSATCRELRTGADDL